MQPKCSCRLAKAGVLPKRLEPQLAKWSAYCELVGYIGSITLRALALQALERRISRFEETMSAVSRVRTWALRLLRAHLRARFACALHSMSTAPRLVSAKQVCVNARTDRLECRISAPHRTQMSASTFT